MQTNGSTPSSFSLSPKLVPENFTVTNLLVMVVQLGAEVDHILHQFHDPNFTTKPTFKHSNQTKYEQLRLRSNNKIHLNSGKTIFTQLAVQDIKMINFAYQVPKIRGTCGAQWGSLRSSTSNLEAA